MTPTRKLLAGATLALATMTGGTVSITAATLGEGETIDVVGTWTQTGGDLTESGGNNIGGPGGMGGDMGDQGGQGMQGDPGQGGPGGNRGGA